MSKEASSTVASRLHDVRRAVEEQARLSGRAGKVRLVAVAKTKPLPALLEAYDAGHRVFGENYVQELLAKASLAPDDIQWHFIGSLQSNKVKALVQSMKGKHLTVETVGTAKLASALDKAAATAELQTPLPIFIQVNTSGEESKSGCAPAEALALANHVRRDCTNLYLRGLMTIGALDYSPNPVCLERLAQIRLTIVAALGLDRDDFELSMGMSGDFAQAIEIGSTSVRVGSTIFGAREYPNK